ncbi:hypothetical protein SLS58_003852 [Diplodia intermedia]|uniref:Uncharacterized protein n=1 Tax=Diplodia intermedia TaxID=856260 RepID=A0ABR3TVT5_9PEZI
MNHNGGGHRGGRNAKRPRPDGPHHGYADRGNPHKRARDNNSNNSSSNSNSKKNNNNNSSNNNNSQPPIPSAPNLNAITDLPTPLPPLPPINNPATAQLAFTHTSVTNYQTETYDRLEWYGDSVIEMAATDLLWDTYPSLPGGRLSQMREALVNNTRLASFARGYGFDNIIAADNHNHNNNNNNKDNDADAPPPPPNRLRIDPAAWAAARGRPAEIKILGDVFEAYIGAIALEDRDHNRNKSSTTTPVPTPIDRTTPLLRALWTPLLLPTPSFADEDERAQDAVKAAAARAFAPSGSGLKAWYEDVGGVGYENKAQQRFRVAFYVRGWWGGDGDGEKDDDGKLKLGEGVGQSKKVARARAARDALDRRETVPELRELARGVEAYLAGKRAKREEAERAAAAAKAAAAGEEGKDEAKGDGR